jgi:nucleoside-diphosphate-sugar epimerase
MMRVLVTGGLGFLGSHLVDSLWKRGNDITVVDNLSTNVVSPEFCDGRCAFVKGDIERLEYDGPRIDVIYHLASMVGTIRILCHAGKIAPAMVQGSERVFDLAARHSASILYVSSSDVYARGGWLSETDTPSIPRRRTPRAEYAQGKFESELLFLKGAARIGLKVNIIRPFNIAGPRQQPAAGFVIARFVRLALQNRPLTVFGDGSQLRSFIHVSEVADACIGVAESQHSGETWNVGNPRNVIRIDSLARLIACCVESNSPVLHVDPRKLFGPSYDDGFSKLPVINKICESLDWAPLMDLERIVRKVAGACTEWRGNVHQSEYSTC